MHLGGSLHGSSQSSPGVPSLTPSEASLFTAGFAFTGVVVTACVSGIGVLARHQAERRLTQEHVDEEQRLRLDAAMQAGRLLSGEADKPADPSVIASGLLALAELDQAELAVTLLVDLWTENARRVSTEAAILVIDAAFDCGHSAAQLFAAELLCRNACRLSPTQSLHWPNAIEGSWNKHFSARTKLLIVEALINMTLKAPADEAALRAVAVRLYGFWASEDADSPDGARVRGCIGKLLQAVIPSLTKFGYQNFIQGNREVTLEQLCGAAETAKTNPDGYLDQLSEGYAEDLANWAKTCIRQSAKQTRLPSLAAAECGSPLR